MTLFPNKVTFRGMGGLELQHMNFTGHKIHLVTDLLIKAKLKITPINEKFKVKMI